MTRAIDVKQLAVLAHAAPSPDMYYWLRRQLARRQLDHSREHVGSCIRIHAGPRRLAAEGREVRFGEVPFSPDIEQRLDSVEVEKESIAATAGEECAIASLDDVRFGPERDLRIGDYLLPDRFDGSRLLALGEKHIERLLAVLRFGKHVTDRDVCQQITVVVDIEAVDRVRMKCVSIRVCIENDHGPRRIRRRLKRVEIAQVESLVAKRRSETESGKMIRHLFLLESKIAISIGLSGA